MIDWQTEEEGELLWQTAPEETAVSDRRPFRWLLLLLILLTAGGWWGSRLYQRAQNNIQLVRDGVRQQHFLAWQAGQQQDADLYEHLTQGATLEHRVVQRLMVEQNLLLNRAPLSLWVRPDQPIERFETAVHLSANLTQAEVQTIVPYLTVTIDGGETAVLLRHHTFYQRRNDIWVESAPPDAFWGEMLHYEGAQLNVLYPERDKGIGRRLAGDLDTVLITLCQDERLVCPVDGGYWLSFQVGPTAVYRLGDNIRTKDAQRFVAIDRANYEIKLPTPTLIGYPMDEASYQALLDGYAAWLVAVLMRNLPATEPIDHAEVTTKLAEFGLPVPAVAAVSLPNASLTDQPTPSQSLLLICNDADVKTAWLYEPSRDSWEAVGRPFELMTSDRSVLKPEPFPFEDNIENQLLTAVPPELRPLNLEIISYQQANGVTAVLAEPSKEHPDLFIFLQEEDEFVLLRTMRKKGHAHLPIEFVGNGRFLSVISYTYARSTLLLIDLEEERPSSTYTVEGVPFERISWSGDGRWFVLINDRALRFVSPADGVEYLVTHNNGGCTVGMWVN